MAQKVAQQIYDRIGSGYRAVRQPDPRIAALINAQLDHCETVVNVGAGTGSYEPPDKSVTAVEPSTQMISQRPKGAAQCVCAKAERLPFADNSFDAATAFLTMHHWTSVNDGLDELRRVARKRIAIYTWDVSYGPAFWLSREYLPEIIALDDGQFQPIAETAAQLSNAEVLTVPIPHDCLDGFQGAYWRRPHAYLDPEIQKGMSTMRLLPEDVIARGLELLRHDLNDGIWDARHQDLLKQDTFDLGYRLIVGEP